MSRLCARVARFPVSPRPICHVGPVAGPLTWEYLPQHRADLQGCFFRILSRAFLFTRFKLPRDSPGGGETPQPLPSGAAGERRVGPLFGGAWPGLPSAARPSPADPFGADVTWAAVRSWDRKPQRTPRAVRASRHPVVDEGARTLMSPGWRSADAMRDRWLLVIDDDSRVADGGEPAEPAKPRSPCSERLIASTGRHSQGSPQPRPLTHLLAALEVIPMEIPSDGRPAGCAVCRLRRGRRR